MEDHSLTDKDVRNILNASKYLKRKRKSSANITEEYSRKLRKIAVSCVLDWKQNGMKRDVFDELQLSSPNVILVYGLVPSETSDTIPKIPIEGSCCQPPFENDKVCCPSPSLMVNDPLQTYTGQIVAPQVTYSFGNTTSSEDLAIDDNAQLQSGPDDEDYDGTPSYFIQTNTVTIKPITLKKLLQHFAAYTGQKKTHMTYLLKLLKAHQPPAEYDSLPSTGTQLMAIKRHDRWIMASKPNQIEPIIESNDGGYIGKFATSPLISSRCAKDSSLSPVVNEVYKEPSTETGT